MTSDSCLRFFQKTTKLIKHRTYSLLVLFTCLAACSSGEYRCNPASSLCIKKSEVCNGVPDCYEEVEEAECSMLKKIKVLKVLVTKLMFASSKIQSTINQKNVDSYKKLKDQP